MRKILAFTMMLLWSLQIAYAQTADTAVQRQPITDIPVGDAAQQGRSDGVADSGFELGSPNPHWFESSTHFGSPICNASCGLSAHTGSNYAWFGGVADALEVATLEQEVVISAENSILTFYLLIGSNRGQGELTIWLDDTELETFTAADASSYASYTTVTLPVSQFADGNTHTLRFYGITYPSGTTNFLVDDVTFTAAPPLTVALTNMTISSHNLKPILLATIMLTGCTLFLLTHKGDSSWKV